MTRDRSTLWGIPHPYRRNSDADLRELERKALANPGDESIQLQYHHALARTTDHHPKCSSIVYYLDQQRDEARHEREVAEYTAKWPKHCTACGGRGGASSYSREHGPDMDFCGTCVESGVCPRCGEETLDMIEETYEDYFKCSACGWDDRKDLETGGLPEETPYFLECDCWELDDARRNPFLDEQSPLDYHGSTEDARQIMLQTPKKRPQRPRRGKGHTKARIQKWRDDLYSHKFDRNRVLTALRRGSTEDRQFLKDKDAWYSWEMMWQKRSRRNRRNPTGDWQFAWHCPSPPPLENWGEDLGDDYNDIIDYITDDEHAEEITFAEFLAEISVDDFLDTSYAGLTPDMVEIISQEEEKGWLHFGFFKSSYPDGKPVMFHTHSGIEHVWEQA